MPHTQLTEFPHFRETVEAHLPGTVSMQDYFLHTSQVLNRYGFMDENTLGVVATSEQGEIGTVYREGLHEASHACGSLAAVLAELTSGRIDVRMDFDDLEQCCVRQKLLSALRYGDLPDLMGMTRLASRAIHEDIERLLGGIVDPGEFDYAYLTGILVHGPHDTHWACPEHGCVVSADLPGGRVALNPLG